MSGILKPPLGRQINRAHPLSRGLVGCWLMNEGGGNIVWDGSGNGRAGNTNGTVWMADGLLFVDDTTDYISFSFSAPGGAFTVVVCAKPTSNAENCVFCMSSSGRTPGFYIPFVTANNQPLLYLGSSNYRYFSSNSPTNIFDGQSHVFAVVVPGDEQTSVSSSQLYIDSVGQNVVSTVATSAQSTRDDFTIGRSEGVTRYYDGVMQYFHLYNRVLTASEIASLYGDPYQMFRRARVEWIAAATSGGGGSTEDVSGTISALAAAAGVPEVARSAAGDIASTSGCEASPAVSRNASGTCVATATCGATAAALRAVAGAVSGEAAVHAEPETAMSASGAVAAQSALEVATSVVSRNVAGVCDVTSECNAAAAALCAVSGEVSGASSFQAEPETYLSASGSIAAQAMLQAAASITGQIEAEGQVQAASSASGAATVSMSVVGTVVGQSGMTANAMRTMPVAGAIAASVGLTCGASSLRSVVGSIASTASVGVSAVLSRTVSGTIICESLSVGTPSLDCVAAGSIDGLSTIIGAAFLLGETKAAAILMLLKKTR